MTDQLPGQTSIPASTQIVERFLFALQDSDFDTAYELLDDNVLYENVGYSRVRGSRGVMKFLRALNSPRAGFEVKIHRTATDGATVLNERSDALTLGRRFRMQFWVCGVFEVRDGRITLWRDYIDALDFVKAAGRGLLALAVPTLRQGF